MSTDTYVRRTHWVKMRMTNIVINKMNELANGDIVQKADVQPKKKQRFEEPDTTISVETVYPSAEPTMPTLTDQEAAVEQQEEEAVSLAKEEGGEYNEDKQESLVPAPEMRKSVRLKDRVPKRDEDFVYSLTQMSIKKGLAKHGEHAKQAIGLEFEQLFVKKKVLKPVSRYSLTES
jgi:hypothetical protein